jgi:hypothetical protein
VALVVAPASRIQFPHGLEAVEQRPADQPHPLLEDRPAGEGEEGPAGAVKIGAVGAGVGRLEGRQLGTAGEVVRDAGEEIRRQSLAQGVELRFRDPPAVVEGAAQGDDVQPGARGLGVALAGGLARHGVQGVGEPRYLLGERALQLPDGGEARQGLPGGQGRQRLERERGDAQEDELPRRIQAGPPPSSIRRCMK